MYEFKVALTNKLKSYISEDKIFNTLPLNDDDNEPIYPLVIYNIKKIPRTPGYIFIVKIDVWDNNPNTIELEKLVKNISKGLNFLSYYDSNLVYHSYNTLIQDVDTQEENINRRQIQTEFKMYEQ
jgi:hypothetical protein